MGFYLQSNKSNGGLVLIMGLFYTFDDQISIYDSVRNRLSAVVPRGD